jgi:hypothetical protein
MKNNIRVKKVELREMRIDQENKDKFMIWFNGNRFNIEIYLLS